MNAFARCPNLTMEPPDHKLLAKMASDSIKRAKKKKINEALGKVREKYGNDIVKRGIQE